LNTLCYAPINRPKKGFGYARIAAGCTTVSSSGLAIGGCKLKGSNMSKHKVPQLTMANVAYELARARQYWERTFGGNPGARLDMDTANSWVRIAVPNRGDNGVLAVAERLLALWYGGATWDEWAGYCLTA
jgi:hypothetical protein